MATQSPLDLALLTRSNWESKSTPRADQPSLACRTQTKATAGLATFSCSINQTGNGFVLSAADTTTSLTPLPVTEPFVVAPASSTYHLVFTTEPGTRGSNRERCLRPQPLVAMRTPSGAIVPSTDQIALSISTSPGSGVLTCASVHAVKGKAKFSGCSINLAGNRYTLKATDTTNPAVSATVSTAFNVV